MNDENKQWLYTLPHYIQFRYGNKKVTVLHGSWFHTAEFVFKSTPWAVKHENFIATGSDIIIAGHCGLPFADSHKNKTWLNAGVIGMPANDGTDRVWFVTLDEKENNVDYQFHPYQYFNTKARNLMLKHGLPKTYADTLLTGIWDNCETLPEEETGMQGKMIAL